jgi:hypothetical protein
VVALLEGLQLQLPDLALDVVSSVEEVSKAKGGVIGF